MKVNDLLLPLVALVLIAVSCEEKGLYQAPRFPKKENLSFEPFSEDIVKGNLSSFLVKDNSIIISSYHPDGYWVHCYDKKTGIQQGRAIPIGRGPGEGMNLRPAILNSQTETVSFYDFSMHKLLYLSLDELVDNGTSVAKEEELDIPLNRAEQLVPMEGGYLLCNYFIPFTKQEEEGLGRYMFFDATGALDAEFSEWPELAENAMRTIYSLPNVAFSEDVKHWVVATHYGAVMESFAYDKNGITRDWIRYFYPTDMENHFNDARNSESISGFSKWITMSEDKIYAVVDFDNTIKQVTSEAFKKQGKISGTTIAIFDRQKGKPLRLIETGVQLSGLAVDGDVLYSFIEREGKEYLAKLVL